MLTIEVVGTDAVIARMSEMPRKVHDALVRELNVLGAGFVAYVKSTKLSGSPLQVRTGTLRRSVNYNIMDDGTQIMLKAGPRNVPYAAYHEYGFHGQQTVKAHTRQFTQVFGRPASGIANVQSFTRNVNYAGRPYMRPSLEEYRQRIIDGMNSAVNEALR